MTEEASRFIIRRLLECADRDHLQRLKLEASRKFGLEGLLKNSDILSHATVSETKVLRDVLIKRPAGSISGVAVVAVMTSPFPCPHGKCTPCPGGPDSEFNSPQSYLGYEPAARRGFQAGFDPYVQVRSRLQALEATGHGLDKIELIVMGGTFTSRTDEYQETFVKRCIEALNDFHPDRDGDARGQKDPFVVNETAKLRCIGITFETRPDCCGMPEVRRMLGLGGTKVELGVQNTDDTVLDAISRGHTVSDAEDANRLLRDIGSKVGFHMMPGLPGTTPDGDLRMFERLFRDERLKPDYLKIYPTLVISGTKLYDDWKAGRYEPMETETVVDLISRIKEILPPWVRFQRGGRDIPVQYISAGVKKSNMRELAKIRLEERGGKCKCIRCREVGHRAFRGVAPEQIQMSSLKYGCCGGDEFFLSFEDPARDILFGFLRLRTPSEALLPSLADASVVRDLRVYGPPVRLGEQPLGGEWQHKGLGEALIEEAERLTRDMGLKRIAVLSGIGSREYYRKLGYTREGYHMVKEI